MAALRMFLFCMLMWFGFCAYNHCFYTKYTKEPFDAKGAPAVTLDDAYDNPGLYHLPVKVSGYVTNMNYFGPPDVGWYELTEENGQSMLIFKKGIPPVKGPKKITVIIEPKPVFRNSRSAFVTGTEILQVAESGFRFFSEFSMHTEKTSNLANVRKERPPALRLVSRASLSPNKLLPDADKSAGTIAPATAPESTGTATFLILVNDISQSNDYLEIKPAHVQALIGKYGKQGGVQMTGILIQSNSTRQQTVCTDFIRLDTMEVSGTWLIAKQTSKKNEAIKVAYTNQLRTASELITAKILLPRDHQYSDVKGALRLAKIAAEHPDYQNANIRVVILSDLLHDVPGQKPHLEPMVFPPNVEIILIGNAPGIDCQKIFPKNKVMQMTNFQSLL